MSQRELRAQERALLDLRKELKALVRRHGFRAVVAELRAFHASRSWWGRREQERLIWIAVERYRARLKAKGRHGLAVATHRIATRLFATKSYRQITVHSSGYALRDYNRAQARYRRDPAFREDCDRGLADELNPLAFFQAEQTDIDVDARRPERN